MGHIFGRVFLAAAAILGTAGSAGAQGVFQPGAMPPPPSAAEPRAKARSDAGPRRPRPRPAAAGTDGAAASSDDVTRTGRRSGGAGISGGSYSDRIDTRGPPPARGNGMQLEDDPRAVQPTMQGGRPGVGMKF